jgi:hypothetical protein
MKYCTVKSYMSKADDNIIISNSHMCAERQLIKQLYRECIKEGKKSHHFTSWIRRKYGHLVIYRESVHGDMISLPCVICRKMIEKYDIPWTAHDGSKWVSSSSGVCMPVSRPTNKQVRVYGFNN